MRRCAPGMRHRDALLEHLPTFRQRSLLRKKLVATSPCAKPKTGMRKNRGQAPTSETCVRALREPGSLRRRVNIARASVTTNSSQTANAALRRGRRMLGRRSGSSNRQAAERRSTLSRLCSAVAV